jgi:hypothetical protein
MVHITFGALGLWLGPELSQSQPSLMALAWPGNPESLSHRKPGQSHSFQAKPGQNITNSGAYQQNYNFVSDRSLTVFRGPT